MNWFLQTVWVIAATILAASPDSNKAYLDPGSGSFIFQLILASLLGAAVVIRAYWKRITGFFKGNNSDQPKDEDE